MIKLEKLIYIAAGFILAFVLICLTARDKEDFKILKLAGYALISTLGFKTSNYVIPTGIFFAGLIMLRDRTNMVSKILAALLGLAVIVLNMLYTAGK